MATIQAILTRPKNDLDLLKTKEEETPKEKEEEEKPKQVVLEPVDAAEDDFLNQMVNEWMKQEQEVEPQEEEVDEEQEEEEVERDANIVWTIPENATLMDRTIWLRVNGAKWLMRTKKYDAALEQKIALFINAHLNQTYKPLGPSHYITDRKFAIFTTPRPITLRPDPLEEIQRLFPDEEWNPDVLAQQIRIGSFTDLEYGLLEPDGINEWVLVESPTPATHSIYLALVVILNNAMRHLIEKRIHSLWVYYVSFMEIFFFCNGRMDDNYLLYPVGSHMNNRGGKLYATEEFAPWTVYGGSYAQRTFDAYDLPDVMGMIADIPLWGKLHTPDFDLGKCYQKSLPFACQRRHLFRLVKRCVEDTSSFWPVFSKLCWVMMADLYPGNLASKQQHLSMRDLLRIRELTDSRETMLRIFTAGGKESGGPLIVFTVFRLHILHLAQHDTEYMKQAAQCIDWNHFEQDAAMLAEIIREHRFFGEDVFAQARFHLTKTSSKSFQTHVFRMHRTSLPVKLGTQLSTVFKDRVLSDRLHRANDRKILKALIDKQNWDHAVFETTHLAREELKDMEIANLKECIIASYKMCVEAHHFYAKHLDLQCKSAIFNALLKIPSHLRFTRDAFAILRDPKYGGASDRIVDDMVQLVHIYHIKRGVPKEYAMYMKTMRKRDFILAYYYVSMAAQLDRISFVTLDADTVRRTDNAMVHRRHRLHEDCDHLFDVYVSMCCKRVCTMIGKGRFGERKVAFDMERNLYICTYGIVVEEKEDHVSDDEEEEEAVVPIQEADEADEEDIAEITTLLPDEMQSMLGLEAPRKKQRKQKISTKPLDSKEEFRKQIRNQCKQFTTIPCGQAVIRYNLHGRALIWRVTAQEMVRIQHCPECGSLHHFKTHGFSGAIDYRCPECAIHDLHDVAPTQCSYCEQVVPVRISDKRVLEIVDPDHAEYPIQMMPFCDSHYKIAWYLLQRGIRCKDVIWKMIRKTQEARAARGIVTSKRIHYM